MARIQTLELSVERLASDAEASNVIGGGGFGLGFGPGGFGLPIGGHCGTNIGGFGGGYGGGFGGGFGGYPAHTWHDTSHWDYRPTTVVPHGNHFDVVPGGYYWHRTGHLHHNHP